MATYTKAMAITVIFVPTIYRFNRLINNMLKITEENWLSLTIYK